MLAIAAARLPGRFQPYEHRRRMGARAAETPVCARQLGIGDARNAPALAAKIRRLRREGRGRRNIPAVALGTDTGGFAALPGPRADAGRHPLRYPFKSYDGRLTSRASAPAVASTTSTPMAWRTTACSRT